MVLHPRKPVKFHPVRSRSEGLSAGEVLRLKKLRAAILVTRLLIRQSRNRNQKTLEKKNIRKEEQEGTCHSSLEIFENWNV
jgi:hypothetical protein